MGQDELRGAGDEELVALYQRTGDSRAFTILFSRYFHLVLGVCLKYLEEEKAEDAAVAVMELALKRLERESPKAFSPWLYAICIRHCEEVG